MHVFKTMYQPGCLGGLRNHFKWVDDKPTQKETKLANPEDDRTFYMGFAHKNTTDLPDSFFRPKMLQIEEAKETNNQAELATTTNESQCKSMRTRVNPILYSAALMFQ